MVLRGVSRPKVSEAAAGVLAAVSALALVGNKPTTAPSPVLTSSPQVANSIAAAKRVTCWGIALSILIARRGAVSPLIARAGIVGWVDAMFLSKMLHLFCHKTAKITDYCR